MPENPIRYRAIDGLRFMAAMGIVARHYAHFSENPMWNGLLAKTYLFVDLFFIISGFVIAMAYGNGLHTLEHYGTFLQNRLARIYPLHLLVFLAFLATDIAAWTGLTAPHEAHVYDPVAIASNLAMVQAWGVTDRLWYNYPSWSISAEWFLYLLFPLVAVAMRRGGALALFAAAALAVAILEALVRAGLLQGWTSLTYEFGFLRAIPTFLIGAGLFCAVQRSSALFRSFAWAWAFFLGAIAAMAAQWDDHIIIALFVLTIAAATGAERAGAKGFLTGSLMGRLGDWSYAVYLIHLILGTALVVNIGQRLLHLHGIALDAYILAAIGLVTGLAGLTYQYFELPARRYLRARAQLPSETALAMAPTA